MSNKKLQPPESLTMAEMTAATGIKRTALLYQVGRGYWRYRGRPGAGMRGGVWFFHPAAELVFPKRKPGPGRPRKIK